MHDAWHFGTSIYHMTILTYNLPQAASPAVSAAKSATKASPPAEHASISASPANTSDPYGGPTARCAASTRTTSRPSSKRQRPPRRVCLHCFITIFFSSSRRPSPSNGPTLLMSSCPCASPSLSRRLNTPPLLLSPISLFLILSLNLLPSLPLFLLLHPRTHIVGTEYQQP